MKAVFLNIHVEANKKPEKNAPSLRSAIMLLQLVVDVQVLNERK